MNEVDGSLLVITLPPSGEDRGKTKNKNAKA